MRVAVIGGGASGMMAALTGAEQGHEVWLLERQARVGRKLLATGNGRCNLSNMELTEANYHGATAAFVRPALAAFGPAAARDFFRGLGLLTVAEPGGRVYPLSEQAGSVVDVLRFAIAEAGVRLSTDRPVTALAQRDGGFRLSLDGDSLDCDRVIVCCGGLANAKLGGGKSGYQLLQGLGHSLTPLYPALVQLKTDLTWVKALKGVRAQAGLRLAGRERTMATGRGEVQFTEYGISGPAVFELSRQASVATEPLTLHLDLLEALDKAQLEQALRQRQRQWPTIAGEDMLVGLLHNRLGRTVLRYAGCPSAALLRELTGAELSQAAAAIKDFALPVTGTLSFNEAQVTAGGIRTDEFRAETLGSRLIPGLYAAGEVLDVDGDCGGYNLHWAWASGRLAGRMLRG